MVGQLEKKQADYTSLVFKENVKGGWIYIFHVIFLSYRGLQCHEDVKDVTEILLLKWIDRPV